MSILRTIVQRISQLFTRYPKYDTTAYGGVYSAVFARLIREGVTVGGTAALPRVEIHSITEGERMDKEGALRQLSLTVETVHNKSLGDAVAINETNLRLLTEYELPLDDGWRCLGVIPGQLQDLTETVEAQAIVYRLLQRFTIYVEQVKTDNPPAPPTPEPSETEPAASEANETTDTEEEINP